MIRCLITMSTLVELAVYILAIIIISLIGGALPYLRKWSSSNLHYFVAISAGVFIGASFLILIPEAINTILEEGGRPPRCNLFRTDVGNDWIRSAADD